MAQDLGFTLTPVEEEESTPTLPFTLTPVTAVQQPTVDVEAEPESGWLETVGGTFVDVAQGVGSGLLGIPQGVLETGTAIFDYVFDTDSTRSVTNFFEDTRDYLGLQPDSALGETVEGITTFGAALIPVVGWVSRASTVARGVTAAPTASRFFGAADSFGKSEMGKALLGSQNKVIGTAQRAAATSLGGGAAEMFVAPDGTGTLADAFDSLPVALRTESDSGLQGRDEAHRRLFNKLKIGTEGAAIGLAAETVLPALGVMSNVAARIPLVPETAKAVNRAFEFAGSKIGDSFGGAPRKYFTFAAGLEREIAEDLSSVSNILDTQRQKAASLFSGFDREAKKAVGGMALYGRNKAGVQKAYDDMLGFLEGDKKALNGYGKNVVNAASNMRNQIDELTDTAVGELELAVKNGDIDANLAQNIIAEMNHNKGSYLRRLYEGAFATNTKALKNIESNPTYKSALEKVSRILARSDKERYATAADASQDAKYIIKKMMVRDALDDGLSVEASAKLMETALRKGDAGSRRPLYEITEGMFKERSKFLERVPELRALMNEIRDPQRLYMQTVSDLATFSVSNRFYSNLGRSLGEGGFKETYKQALPKIDQFIATGKGGRPLIVSGADLLPEQIATLGRAGYTRLGEQVAEGGVDTIFRGKYGSITGDFIAPELYNALTIPVRSDTALGKLYGLSLQAKGLSQISKTVLNPLSQVRNFYSGAFMVGANGNFMRNAGLGESLSLTFKKLNNLPDKEAADFATMIGELGLRDESLAVNEFRRLIRENVKSGDVIQTALDKTPIIKSLQATYSNTDTYWKTVGFLGEKAKITAALRKSGIDSDNVSDRLATTLAESGLGFRSSDLTGKHGFVNVYASDIVKETMPIYTRVPEVIKGIRRVPVFGNFVAFPAEVLRNTTNILDRGLKELSFTPSEALIKELGPQRAAKLATEVRAIGANRLASYVTSSYAIPKITAEAASNATGVSQEQIDDMRPLMPYFVQGHQIMPLGKPKNGKFEYLDLSYMMPYDFAFAPARAALETYSQKGALGAGEAEKIMSGAWTALTTFMEPFAGEALLSERIRDALPSEYFGRGGITRTGAKVWYPSDTAGDKVERSLYHILGGIYPSGLEYFVQPKPEGFVPGRVTRATTDMPGSTGQEYDNREEFLTAISGFRKMELNIPKSLEYSGYEYTSLRSAAQSQFNNIAKRNDSTNQDVIEAYAGANEDLFRIQKNMYLNIEAARAAGMSDGAIIANLRKEANLGQQEVSNLMRGVFTPSTVSKETIKDVLGETYIKKETRVLDSLPLADLVRMRADFLGKSLLDQSLTGRPIEAEMPAPAQQPAQPAQQPSQGFTLTPVEPVTSTPSQGFSLTPAQPDASLYGSNPIDAMKNLQIAQRTRQ